MIGHPCGEEDKQLFFSWILGPPLWMLTRCKIGPLRLQFQKAYSFVSTETSVKYWCTTTPASPHPRGLLKFSEKIMLFFLGVLLWFTGYSQPQILGNPKYLQLLRSQGQWKSVRDKMRNECTLSWCHCQPSQIFREITGQVVPGEDKAQANLTPEIADCVQGGQFWTRPFVK